MILTSIRLRNFRIHKNVEYKFSKNLNYIVGDNGKGKTSILESIYYLCTTKSFIAKNDNEVIRFNNNDFEIWGRFNESTEDNVRIIFNLNDSKKYYFLNKKYLSKSSEIVGKFPVVLLTPSDHSITQGVPGERRKFFNSVISQASSTYLKSLLDYNRTLKQRSSLLMRMKEYRNSDMIDELNAWTIKLVNTGTEIIKRRVKFIKEFNTFVKESYSRIMDNLENPNIEYFYLNGYKGNDIKEYFTNAINERREDELRRVANLVGPHRDDFLFTINNVNLKMYGSQGQHKTYQAVLRFAEFFYLKNTTSKTPIFLLDDVFGELDPARAHKISDYLQEIGQAFVTLTDFGKLSFLKKKDTDKIFKLNNEAINYA